MKLSDLGFDPWFEDHAAGFDQAGCRFARVSAVDRGSYLIKNESAEVPAELAGKLSYKSESPVALPCVGDWVTAQYHNEDKAAIIHQVFPRKTYCLLGSSGVGKTTLINRLIGQDAFDTKAVSATGEGTHATSRRQLVVLSQGAMLIDMPGMRELGVVGADDGIDTDFEDLLSLSANCRYANCSHEHEPGCAIRAAVESGELSEDRYSNYIKLKKESEYHEMSYLDKRRKDKAFGRFIKSAKKRKKY